MRLIVTGAAGFIASHLCDLLVDAGHTVIGVDAFRPTYEAQRRLHNVAGLRERDTFELREFDLLESDPRPLLEGCDAVFHLAGRPGVRDSFGRSFDDYVDDNLRSTQRLLDAMLAVGVPRIVYASSSSVYGELGDRSVARETDRCRPLSPYGATKLAAENLALAYQDNFDLEAVTLRYFTIYGPRQRPDMAIQKFIEAGLAEMPIEVYGDGSQRRDVTFVEDCVRATASALELATGIYNVAGGSVVTLNEILDEVDRALASPLIRTYTKAQPGDVRTTSADSAKLRATGFRPRVDLAEGIRQQVEHSRRTTARAGGLRPTPSGASTS